MRFRRLWVLAVYSLIVGQTAICQKDKQNNSPKLGFLQCRSDAQKWTTDPFDKNLDAKSAEGAAVMVNGQLRGLPHLTYGVTMGTLLQRIYEMDVCKREDADFEKQFSTYSTIEGSYTEEQVFRYKLFLTKHHLDEQFIKEAAEEFK